MTNNETVFYIFTVNCLPHVGVCKRSVANKETMRWAYGIDGRSAEGSSDLSVYELTDYQAFLDHAERKGLFFDAEALVNAQVPSRIAA